MKLKHAFRVPRVDVGRFERNVRETFSAAIQRAALDYLITISDVIPVWTGESIGTFYKLASEVGFHLDASPSPTAPESRFRAGASQGTGEVIVGGGGQYSFSYSTDLDHLIENEYQNANAGGSVFFRLLRPGPYDFQGKGKRAVEKVFNAVTPPMIPIRIVNVK